MKVLGVIVEYNPLHRGHVYHLNSSMKLVTPDFIVAVMSGNFVQRGEPAIVDKFARTEMALKAGIDVVIELPTVYAIQDANGFATGAIKTLEATNVVTDIVFGSESDDIKTLERLASIIVEESKEYRTSLKKYLKKGLSFPNARRYAISEQVLKEGIDVEQIKFSNNILGVEYLAALKRTRSQMRAHIIKRIGSSYNDEQISTIPSATAIRKSIKSEKKTSGIPQFTHHILEREFSCGRGPVFSEDLFAFTRLKVIMLGREGLEQLYGFNEGIAKRMIKAVKDSHDMKSFLLKIKTKRFTFTRIKRRVLYALFDLEREFVKESNEFGPQYLRILGFTQRGRKLLRMISDYASKPIVSNVSNFNKALEKRNVNVSLARQQLMLDIKSTDFHTLLFKNENEREIHRDFCKPLEIK